MTTPHFTDAELAENHFEDAVVDTLTLLGWLTVDELAKELPPVAFPVNPRIKRKARPVEVQQRLDRLVKRKVLEQSGQIVGGKVKDSVYGVRNTQAKEIR